MTACVMVCMSCSTLNPADTPHGAGCTSTDWRLLRLVESLGRHARVEMPHPDGGWPEVHITSTYMVRSDDRAVVEQVATEMVASDEKGER